MPAPMMSSGQLAKADRPWDGLLRPSFSSAVVSDGWDRPQGGLLQRANWTTRGL